MNQLYIRLLFSVVLSALLYQHSLYGQSAQQALPLLQRTASPHTDLQELSSAISQQIGAYEAAQVFLLLEDQTQGKQRNQGFSIQEYLNNSWVLARIDHKLEVNALQRAGISAWAPLHSEDKISPLIKEQMSNSSSDLAVLVALDPSLNKTQQTTLLRQLGITPQNQQSWTTQDIWQCTLGENAITQLAQHPLVRYLSPILADEAIAFQAKGFTNAQVAQQPINLGGYALTGVHVTIGVGDDSDPYHVDFDDRMRSLNPMLFSTHGFHTTGTVGGSGLRDPLMKGYAPASNLISDYFSQVIANTPTYHQDFNMTITNNSYGTQLHNCSYMGTYDLYSQILDQQMIDLSTLLHVFAAANDGNMTCSPYPLGFATVAGAYSTAKNVLTVGSNGKTRDILSSFSSRGPTKDGRLKPEITAVGTRLYSTVDHNNYELNSGTSMACPNVAGAAGLLYEHYKLLHSGQNPRGSLIKTLLMNGADDMGNTGPDFRFGFGLMNIGHSLRMIDSNRYFIDSSNTGTTQNFTIQIPANTAQAKIMLYWNDPAAAPLSAQTLVNDLNLQVVNPTGSTLLPWILNPAPQHVDELAVQGLDARNNVEQITIDQPDAGTYTIKVLGQNVPVSNQEYIVAYDFIPQGISIQYPFGGEALPNTDSLVIYWEASAGSQNFDLSFSDNNGNSWQNIQSNVGADQRAYIWWLPPGITSNQCLIRISRGSESSTSKVFTLSGRPIVQVAATAEQCPGSIIINWQSVPSASAYRVYQKQGGAMVPIATTSNLSYTLSGLALQDTQWLSVAPIINGSTGIRAIAVFGQADSGDCAGAAPGDLHLVGVESPLSGRQLTGTTFGNSESLLLRIVNQDESPASQYRISYRVNGGSWQTQDFTTIIAPAQSVLISVGAFNFAAVGEYPVELALTNLAMSDPISGNDSQSVVIRQLANPALDLSADYLDDFESVSLTEHKGSNLMGLPGADRWDFTTDKKNGRVRNKVTSEVTISGSQSMSLDHDGNTRYTPQESSFNTLTGTFNLSNYSPATDEVRCSFDYLLHGVPKYDTGNQVWLRGSDNDPWIPLFEYQIDTYNLGQVYPSGSISLTDYLTAAGQTFSSSTQIRLGQHDTSMISTPYFGNGVTFDNFALYTVTDDAELLAIDSVYHYSCSLGDQVPLKIRVVNRMLQTIYNVQVSYQLNGETPVTALIDSIAGKDTLSYTFSELMNLSSIGSHNLSAWVYVATDTYRLNDSLLNLQIINQPIIDSFPYLEQFETNDGFFFPEGNLSSWEYGTPTSPKINHAASGNKVWKTNLDGQYNNRELSFLYSPCFDISTLENPMLSFHLAADIEPPGESIYDRAYVEYSNDGHTWQLLGQAGMGTNWYHSDSAQAWTHADETYWHVASIPLPKEHAIISFRFVLWTDQGASYEGIALDDIHIFDLQEPIFDTDQFATPISQNLVAGQDQHFSESGTVGLIINSPTNINAVKAQAYKHLNYINADSSQYYLPKSFLIQSNNGAADSMTMKFFVTDEAMNTIRADQQCTSCGSVKEVQQLGISQYTDPDKTKENNLLSDNTQGNYHYIPREQIIWVPYDKGYYTLVKLNSFSEYWFNDGGPTRDQHIAADLFDFSAVHQGERAALLSWQSSLNTQMMRYHVQSADTSMQFNTLTTVEANGGNQQVYQHTDLPALLQSPAIFYRIRYELQNGAIGTSIIRRLDWDGRQGEVIVYPNPYTDGDLTIDWIKGNNEPLEWALFSSTGQRVNFGKIEASLFSGQARLNLRQLAMSKGIYILKVNSGDQHWEFKIVYL